MATRLKNIIRFTGLQPGVPTALPHLLNIDNRAVRPDLLATDPDNSVTLSADATNVTITNQLADEVDADVYAEHWHTIEREFGSFPPTYEGALVPQPFIIGGVSSPPILQGEGFILQGAGGIQRGIIYTDFADLVTDLNKIDGWKTIFVDDRFGAPVLPAEVFQLPQFTILSALGPKDGGAPRTFLEIPEGCQLLGLRFITGALYLDCQNTATPIVPGSDFVGQPNRIMIGDLGPKGGPRTQLDANGGGPIFELPDDSFNQLFYHGQPGVSGNPIFSLGENTILLLRALPDGLLPDNLASGPASSSYSVGLEAGAAISADPAGAFGGTFALDNFGSAGSHVFSNDAIPGAAATVEFLDQGGGSATAGTTPKRGRFFRPGVIRNLTAFHNTADGDGPPVDYTVEINGGATALTVSLATGVEGGVSSGDEFVIVGAGDEYAVTASKAADIGVGDIAIAPVVSFEFFGVVQFP